MGSARAVGSALLRLGRSGVRKKGPEPADTLIAFSVVCAHSVHSHWARCGLSGRLSAITVGAGHRQLLSPEGWPVTSAPQWPRPPGCKGVPLQVPTGARSHAASASCPEGAGPVRKWPEMCPDQGAKAALPCERGALSPGDPPQGLVCGEPSVAEGLVLWKREGGLLLLPKGGRESRGLYVRCCFM